jgi:cytochrome P450
VVQVLGDQALFPRNANFREAFATVGRGLLVLDGAEWRRHRRLASAAFYPERLRLVTQCAGEVADRLADKWREGIGA